MIEQNKEFELRYWLKKDKTIVLNTYKKFFEIVSKELFKDCKRVADIGCGAYGGIFNEIQFPVMYGIDPLWDKYRENGLLPENDNIIKIQASSMDFIRNAYYPDKFTTDSILFKDDKDDKDVSFLLSSLWQKNYLPPLLDCIFSINAIDHSGDIRISIENIYDALRKGGLFAFHVQLRTVEQFDAGHRIALSEDDILNTKVSDMKELFYKKYERCPFGNQGQTGKSVAAIIGVWEK